MYGKDDRGFEIVIDRREMLRVKVKSLAEEARIIRKEERRSRGVIREMLREHRVLDLRREARSAHVAYALVKGRSYEQVERKAKTPPDWARVKRLIAKYGREGWNGPEVT